MLDGLTEWVTGVVESLGYGGVALLVALESVFPPIPSEVVLPLAGFVAAQGETSAVGMVAAATVGSIIGAWVLYGISASIGPDRLHAFTNRRGRWVGVSEEDLDRAEAWFDRRGDVAVLLGRCVPLIRSLVSVPAGFRRMPLVRFSVLTVLGSLAWNTALIGAGAALGNRWQEAGDAVGVFQAVVAVGLIILTGRFLWSRFRQRRLGKVDHLAPHDE